MAAPCIRTYQYIYCYKLM